MRCFVDIDVKDDPLLQAVNLDNAHFDIYLYYLY